MTLKIRKGKLFEAGDYPDKGFSLTESEMAAAVAAFAPVAGNIEHRPSLLDGKIGGLTKVWQKGKELFGEVAVPEWLHELTGGEPIKPSLEWDRQTKRICGVAYTIAPRITDAALMSAFSQHAQDDDAVWFDAAHFGKGHFITVDGHAVYIEGKSVSKGDVGKAAVKHGLSAESHAALSKAHDEGKIQTDEHLFKTIAHAKKAMAGDTDKGKAGKPEGEAIAAALNKHATGEKEEPKAQIQSPETLPELKGTEKQISWAKDIRQSTLSDLRNTVASRMAEAKPPSTEVAAVTKYGQKLHDRLSARTEARDWIDDRHTQTADHLRVIAANAGAELHPPSTEPPSFPDGMTRQEYNGLHSEYGSQHRFLTVPALHVLHDAAKSKAEKSRAEAASDDRQRETINASRYGGVRVGPAPVTRSEDHTRYQAKQGEKLARYLAAKIHVAKKTAPANFSINDPDTPNPAPRAHDGTPSAKGETNPMKFMETLKALLHKQGAAPEDLAALDAVKFTADDFGIDTTAQLSEADKARFTALEGENARLRTAHVTRDAETFADAQIAASRAVPGERANIVALFTQAAEDDAAAPRTVKFSAPKAGGGTELRDGTRVDALRASFAARVPHMLTEERLRDTDALVLLSQPQDPNDIIKQAREQGREYAKTANGTRQK